MKTTLRIFAATAVFAACAGAQQLTGYIDTYIVKVKPEKRTEFDAVARKIADANRKHNGDRWVTYSVEYGEGNTVIFSSVRASYAEIDKGGEAFMGAMKESYGAGFLRIFQDMNNCVISSRAEVRRRRPDLSWNLPGDMSAIERHVGESKWLRMLTVRVRPGKFSDYEENAIKVLKATFEKAENRRPTFVSQAAAGPPNGTYYFSSFGKALADFDMPAGSPMLRDMMGAEAYERYQKASGEDTIMSEWTIARIVPELSNPPETIVNVSTDFWRPKPPMAASPKPKVAARSAKPGE
jgi:hypothetical protein